MKAIVWKHLCWGKEGTGLEHLELGTRSARATLIWVDDRKEPYHLEYEAEWDPNWTFRLMRIRVRGADTERETELERGADSEWLVDGAPAGPLSGCSEVDLWPTPFTNTLPIRRLSLAVGSPAEIRVAWVAAPELTVAAREQRYTRLSKDVVRFESLDDGFRADLVVDGSGLVVSYPDLFERIV